MQDLEQVAESSNRDLRELWREVLIKTAKTMTVTGINSAFVDIGENDVVAEGLLDNVDTSDVETLAHGTPLTKKPEFKKMIKKVKDQESDENP
jgi:hypothetical protein